MSRYIPQPSYPDMMPVDISFVFEDEKPAGKHGFLRADGEIFRFEDGTPGKFWGVNFNGGACFPDRDYAKKVARRLAQTGCNIVRFHQLDAEFDTPNIYGFTKGKRVSTTRVLDPRSLDALDYLISCLKAEGIYCYMDMSTYRKYKEGDGVEQYWLLRDNARPWSIIDPHLIELQKEFARTFWNHYNPYTGLCHKDDPVFVMTEITNECDIFTNPDSKKANAVTADYYVREFREFFRDWLAERGIDYDWQNCDLYTADAPMIDFKIYLTDKYFREMRDCMREIGVRIPVTGTNWTHTAGLIRATRNMDYTDSHHYFYDWKWGNTERICANRSITSADYCFPNLAKMRVEGKPFFISEWDMPWPNSYRAEGPIYYAAVGALQNWSGFAIHTYAYGTRLDKMEILGKEQSSPVGGVPYREGIFSVWNDPAKYGLFYHSALILRRGDVSPAEKKVGVLAENLAKTVATAHQGLLEQHRAFTVFPGDDTSALDEVIPETAVVPLPANRRIVSDNGQLWRDLGKQIGAVDTPRTKVVYGMLGRAGLAASITRRDSQGIALDGLFIEPYTDFGVIAMSSLTNEPIEKSDNILISAIGRARNTGAQFDGDKMIERGQPPILAEVIRADIEMKIENGEKLAVWGVNAEGYYAGKLPTRYENGILSFTIGDEQNPACYYLVVAE